MESTQNIGEIQNNRIVKLFINNRVERISLPPDSNPHQSVYIPILDEVVVISNVGHGTTCYAIPPEIDELNYNILIIPPTEADGNTPLEFNIPDNAIRGLRFAECSMLNPVVRRRRIAYGLLQDMNNNNVTRRRNSRDAPYRRRRIVMRYSVRSKADPIYKTTLRLRNIFK